jgi:hypothetical protein
MALKSGSKITAFKERPGGLVTFLLLPISDKAYSAGVTLLDSLRFAY